MSDCEIVTAILPHRSSGDVIELLSREQIGVLVTQARGTVLKENSFKRFLPSVSPSKTMLQMLVTPAQVEHVLAVIIEAGNLDLQATGAAFSSPCVVEHIGADCRIRMQNVRSTTALTHELSDTLSAIYCVTPHRLGDKVSRAAIQAGSHGPIVFYCEGRGLRDRHGWLRITKDPEQEVLLVVVDDNDVEQVFEAMGKAAGMHLPGRGFMYRAPIDKGLFNLRSWSSHPHYAANMQQIIAAIDHIAGHQHWRDHAVAPVGPHGRALGISSLTPTPSNRSHTCLTAIVSRSRIADLNAHILDCGAPGLNVNYAHFVAPTEHRDQLSIDEEYAIVRTVTDHAVIESIVESFPEWCNEERITDVFAMSHPVNQVLTYEPGSREFRAPALFSAQQ